MELKPFRHEASFAVGETSLRLVMDIQTISRLETMSHRSIEDLLERVGTSTALASQFVWAATREGNPDVTVDQIAGIMFSPDGGALMVTLGDLVKRAFYGRAFKAPEKPKRAKKMAA